jgi:hypothetical protein
MATPVALALRRFSENLKKIIAGSRAPTPFTVLQIF